MTHTVACKHQIDDCNFPLTVTWELHYEVTDGELSVVDKHLESVMVWLTDDLGVDARLYDLDKLGRDAVAKRLEKLLDEELLRDACWTHWEQRGYDEELEAA